MPETYEAITVRAIGFTLSRIVWRRFRRPMPKVVERTLDHNPGLAGLGPTLPLGTTFDLVIPGPEEERDVRPVVRLWGASS